MSNRNIIKIFIWATLSLIFIPFIFFSFKSNFLIPIPNLTRSLTQQEQNHLDISSGINWTAQTIEWKVGSKAFSPPTLNEVLYFNPDGSVSGDSSKRFQSWSSSGKNLTLIGNGSQTILKYDGVGYISYVYHPDRKSPYFLRISPTKKE